MAATLTTPENSRRSLFADGMAVIWAIALAKLLFHIYFNNQYGYFRDEFDYMSCGDHLQWGYVDQPPLVPFLTHICRAVFGDSLRSIRFIPALASSLLVVQTALLARELGGRRFALLLAALCTVVAPQYLSNAGLLGTNCLEPNLWTGCAYFAVLAVKRDPRHWVWFSVTAGVGLEEKYTIALLGLGLVTGLILTAQRKVFLSKWIWLGGLAAFLIFLPNVLWNIHYDWPFLQLMRAIRAEGRDVVWGPVEFLWQQILIVNPLTALIWLPGLFALFFSRLLKPYRFLGWSYLVCYTALFLLHGKNYYLSPIDPMLMAAGAVFVDYALGGVKLDGPVAGAEARRTWWKPAIVILLLANGAYLAPVAVPVLSPERFLAYVKYLPIKPPVNEYSHARAALPQWYSDQFGWKEISDAAVAAWNRVPPDQHADCGIFAQDYGQAGAIDFFGRAQGLPPAMSGDRTYFLWGPHSYSGNCMIVLDDRKEVLERYWNEVEYWGKSAENPWALEQQLNVFICRGKKFESWSGVWPKLKRWR